MTAVTAAVDVLGNAIDAISAIIKLYELHGSYELSENGTIGALALDRQIWWYSARAAGIIAWALASAGVIWGIWLSGRPRGRGPRPAWLLDLHRFLGGLSLAFTAVHLGALVADSYFHYSWAELFVPGRSPYRAGAVTFGIVALAGAVVVEVSSLVMRRLPRRVWHAIHLASYAVFVLATVHGWRAGTDTTGQTVLRSAYLGVAALVVAMTLGRIATAGAASRRTRAELERGATPPPARRRVERPRPSTYPATADDPPAPLVLDRRPTSGGAEPWATTPGASKPR